VPVGDSLALASKVVGVPTGTVSSALACAVGAGVAAPPPPESPPPPHAERNIMTRSDPLQVSTSDDRSAITPPGAARARKHTLKNKPLISFVTVLRLIQNSEQEVL
jgi:hypothetical protein